MFIDILDHIRTSNITKGDLNVLNGRVGKELDNEDSSLAITLSTRRDTVDYINNEKLKLIDEEPTMFYGIINGEFSKAASLLQLNLN